MSVSNSFTTSLPWIVRVVYVITMVIPVALGQEIRLDNFPFFVQLDARYNLSWSFNDTHIAFRASVRTNGYVGFGISGSGGMVPADVVIGWVKNGHPHFADRHTLGYFPPQRDSSQDWFLMNATERDGVTTLTVLRALDTCDWPDDKPITVGTTRIIYSYRDNDPSSEGNIRYHGPSTRGTRSLLLLEPTSSFSNISPLPTNVFHYDMVMQRYQVPDSDTTYACLIGSFQSLNLNSKHHLVRVEPIIQQGHENLVHHIVVILCLQPIPESLLGSQYVCLDDNPELKNNCTDIFLSWSIGGGGYEFPQHVGFPMGRPQDPFYYVMEVHYDNPTLAAGLVDSSGLRIYLSPELRPNDAGMMTVGVKISPSQIIPPLNNNFHSLGYCHKDCLGEALGEEEIHVIGNIFHSHVLARKMNLRIFRNETEMKPIQTNDNFDFEYQEMAILGEEFTIKRGDSLILDCGYDSSSRTSLTFGGLSTREEKCLTFLFYYPQIPLSKCQSETQFTSDSNTTDNLVNLLAQLHFHDWSSPMVQENFKQLVRQSPMKNTCSAGYQLYQINNHVTPKIDTTNSYIQPPGCP